MRYRLLFIQVSNIVAILGLDGFGDTQAESLETKVGNGSILMHLLPPKAGPEVDKLLPWYLGMQGIDNSLWFS